MRQKLLFTDQSETVDLIDDAGFKDGDFITLGVDIVAGNDATCDKILVVSANGSTGSCTAKGTTLNNQLVYNGD
jgi:hypothetical protein